MNPREPSNRRAQARCRHQRRRPGRVPRHDHTPDATLTDDGNPRSLRDRIDREIFTAYGHMNVESEKGDGLNLLAQYRNDTWADAHPLALPGDGDKISRIDTGQA
jgi:hypothetical protein